MKSQQDQHRALVEAFLPKDLFQYFEITNVSISEEQIQVDLDELNNPPSSHVDNPDHNHPVNYTESR